MKRIAVALLSLLVITTAGAQESGQRRVKMTLTRLCDDRYKEVVAIVMREDGEFRCVVRGKEEPPFALYLSPKLTADGVLLSVWAEEGETAYPRRANPKIIVVKLNTNTEFEFRPGKFRIFIALETPEGTQQ